MVSMTGGELSLRGTARYVGDVAFGPVFEITTAEPAGPVGAGEAVLVTILAGDDPWADFLHAHPEPALVEADFTFRAEDEKYATASFSGFVDAAGRSWDLQDVREAEG